MRKLFQVIGPGRFMREEVNVRYSEIEKIRTAHGTLLYYQVYEGDRPYGLAVGYLVDLDAELTPGTEIMVNSIDRQEEEEFVRDALKDLVQGNIVFFA